jgi:DNA-binding LacI/PurR family transcriptional regulator
MIHEHTNVHPAPTARSGHFQPTLQRIADQSGLSVTTVSHVLSGHIETKLLLRTEVGVRTILALSNLNALGAIRALTEEKRRIPEDVSIISFDD